ncbi:MAG: hypothetical protein ACUZ8H_10930 [Candidatus Anammoxibacter sp.]
MRNRYLLIVIIIISLSIPAGNSYSRIYEKGAGYNSGADSSDNFLSEFSGDITLRYKGRFLEGEDGSDQDFYQSLRLNYSDPMQNKISGYFHGSMREDLEDPSSLFRSIDDTYTKTLRGYLYEFYGIVSGVGVLENVKIGRQYSNDVENLHFDGVHLSFKPFKNTRFTAYGGIPVHFFESSSDGDWLAGVSAEVKPVKSLTIRFDYISTSDNSSNLGNNLSDRHDNLMVFSLWQKIKPWWRIYSRYSMLDSISRDFQVKSFWNFASINLDVQFSYYRQAQNLDSFTIEFDEFTPLLGGYQPYDQYSLDVYKGIGQHMGMNFGLSFRELKDESDEGAFNHDFERYYITYSIFDYPFKGLTYSITAEDYETAGDDVQSLSFDITQDFNKRLKVSLGTYYSLYKFDVSVAPEFTGGGNLTTNRLLLNDSLTESERDNVRSYYIKIKKKIFKRWEIDGRYEFEKFNADTFHTVSAKLKLRF